MRKFIIHIIFQLALLFIFTASIAQQEKQITHKNQVWISINNTVRLTNKLGFVADFHVRRNNFAADPSFYFLRAGGCYWLNDHISAVLGYAHTWAANQKGDEYFFSNENRLYEQLQFNNKWKKFNYIVRFRNEQRWIQKTSNGEVTDDYLFTNRVRILTGFNYQLFKNPYVPKLMMANEVAIHFGKPIVYNSFDQNRFSIGVLQKITNELSCDLAYMLVYQQKYSGYQYDLNNTLRLFFYYQPDLRNKKITPHLPSFLE